MKKHFILAVMAMSALFTACDNESPMNQEAENLLVSFTIGGIDSRASTAADFSTVFENNDAIGISGTNVTPEMQNVKYNVTVTGNTAAIAPEEESSFAYGNESAEFNAYYPYSADFANAFSVQTDQSKGIATSDFLTAIATGSKQNPSVALDFKHRLVLVQVSLSGVDNVSSVTLKNVKTDITFTPSTDGTTQGAVALDEEAAATDIIMFAQTDGSIYWAIVPAQEIAAGELFIVTTSTGKTYKYTTSAATTFTESTLAKYSLSLAAPSVLVAYNPVSVTAWNPQGGIDTGGNLEEKIIIHSISNRNALPATESWGAYNNGTQITTAVHEDGKIKFTGLESSASWYNNTLYYYAGENFVAKPDKKYKVTINGGLLDGADTDCKIQIVVLKKNQGKVTEDATSNTDLVYGTDDNKNKLSNYHEFKVADNGATNKIFYFYPESIGTAVTGNVVNATEISGDVVIAIAPIADNNNNNAYNRSFYINSIKIEEMDK